MNQPDYIGAIVGGDPVILRLLYHEQFPVILRLVRSVSGSEADAMDVFQDAIVIIYQKAKEPDFRIECLFSTYFYGICRNLLLNRLTKKSATYEVTLDEDVKQIAGDISIESHLLQVERGNLFWKAFRRLGEDCQKVLELFFQKIPMEKIAEQMGYKTEGYARRRKLQCKTRLVELVKSDPAYRELL